jgi:mRNA-degrading endonuclease RelE of RelBE toxin-antitoxin system
MFQIRFTENAIEDLQSLKKVERKRIIAELQTKLTHEPMTETRNRKRLRPNELAEWELRSGDFRVFYDVDQENQLIKIEAVGYKRGDQLFIRGKEYQL